MSATDQAALRFPVCAGPRWLADKSAATDAFVQLFESKNRRRDAAKTTAFKASAAAPAAWRYSPRSGAPRRCWQAADRPPSSWLRNDLFDHVVGTNEHRRGHSKAERPPVEWAPCRAAKA